MPTQKTIDQFIARVVEGAHAEAIEEFYTPQASMQENMSAPRQGRDVLAAKERATLARVKNVKSTCVQPIFVNGHHVVIRWVFEFEWLDGRNSRIEELAYQRWETDANGNEQIAQETFFYDPAQFVAK